MGNNLVYMVYATVNKVNGSVYIGIQATKNPYKFDGRLSEQIDVNKPTSYNRCKSLLQAAILKYGLKNFYKVPIKVFNCIEDANALYEQLVDKEFVKRNDTYNTITAQDPVVSDLEVYQFDTEGKLLMKWKSISELEDLYRLPIKFENIISNKMVFYRCLWSFNPHINVEKCKVPICQYNKEGLLLATFDSAYDAAKKLQLDKNAILKAIARKKLYAGCYFLKTDLAEAVLEKGKVLNQPVYRYLRTGEYDTKFDCLLQAARQTPTVGRNSISKAIANNSLNGGYYWSFIKENNYFNIETYTYKIKDIV